MDRVEMVRQSVNVTEHPSLGFYQEAIIRNAKFKQFPELLTL